MVREALRRGRETGQATRIHLALRNLLTAAAEGRGGGGGGAGEDPALDLDPPEAIAGSDPLDGLSTRSLTLIEKCHYPWYFLIVDTDGDVRPCCWASISWGNLNREDFTSIWNGPAAQSMRRDFLRNHIPPCCRGKHCRVDL